MRKNLPNRYEPARTADDVSVFLPLPPAEKPRETSRKTTEFKKTDTSPESPTNRNRTKAKMQIKGGANKKIRKQLTWAASSPVPPLLDCWCSWRGALFRAASPWLGLFWLRVASESAPASGNGVGPRTRPSQVIDPRNGGRACAKPRGVGLHPRAGPGGGASPGAGESRSRNFRAWTITDSFWQVALFFARLRRIPMTPCAFSGRRGCCVSEWGSSRWTRYYWFFLLAGYFFFIGYLFSILIVLIREWNFKEMV